MADEPAPERPDDLEEEEGGPIKSFLEHLEDLRWVLIKSGVAAGTAMLLCLLAGNYVVRILEWPLHHSGAPAFVTEATNYIFKKLLHRAPLGHSNNPRTVSLFFGTNQLSSCRIGTNDPFASVVGTNENARLQIVPLDMGTNRVLGLQLLDEPAAAQNQGLPIEIVILSPAGAFVVATKVAFYSGLVLASPFIFYFVAQFVFPALRLTEKKYIYRGLGFGFGLFLTGVCFCYFLLMPAALAASRGYAEWFGFSASQWRAEEYISFVCKFMLGMGIGFELPVVVLTLVKIGVLSHRTLASARPYVIVISFVLGAILTTPEVITQVLMAIPLYGLFEVSVLIAWYWERQDRKREAAAGQALGEA